MNESQKFDQIWGFRRNVDSSSDDSKSNSDAVKDQEKLGLVPENDGVSETNNEHVQVTIKPKRTRSTPKKEKKNKKKVKSKPKKYSSASSKTRKGCNNSRKNKSKSLSQMTVSDDFRIFTESILNDLRLARETMFAKMRKEMDQLVIPKPSNSVKKMGSGNNPTQKLNPKPRQRKTKTTQAKPKQKNELATSKGPQEQVNNENTEVSSLKDPILNDTSAKNPISKDTSAKNSTLKDNSAKNPIVKHTSAKDPILNDNSAKNPILIDASARNPILIDTFAKNPILDDSLVNKPIFTNAPDQIVTSSSYLTLPLVMPYSISNDTSLALARGNYYGLQSFGHNNTESPCVGNGYPVELNHHQRFHNSNNFGIPSRVQGFSRDNNLLGTRMINGGGIRYNAGLSGHTLPNNLDLNGFHSLYPN